MALRVSGDYSRERLESWQRRGTSSSWIYLPGFHHREEFIRAAEEQVLVDALAGVAFADFEMRGVVARRRVAFFGRSYDRVRSRAASGVPVAPARAGLPTGAASIRTHLPWP